MMWEDGQDKVDLCWELKGKDLICGLDIKAGGLKPLVLYNNNIVLSPTSSSQNSACKACRENSRADEKAQH